MTVICVAIPTFRRPAALRAVVTAVLEQLPDLRAIDAVGAILVVDNDPARSGEDTAAELGVRYVAEPQPGIAAVRNRALDEVAGDADAVVFIDDDEVPEAGWIVRLVGRYLETSADAIAGRVITVFPPDCDPWVRASGAFVRPERRDGIAMAEAATNNLLLDLGTVANLRLRFDERFGLTGGSDSLFTRQLTRRGGSIVWCQDAVVTEREEAVRFTRAWVLMRTFRFGNTWARVSIALAESPPARIRARAVSAAAGFVRVGQGFLLWIAGAATGSLARRAHGMRTVYRGAGNVAGSLGYAHDEYGRRRRLNPAP